MNKKIFVCGSIAYDHLLYYPGNFSDLVSSAEKGMNLSINVSKKFIEFGGTAGNIAYNLTLLGELPVVLGVAGKDFQNYETWLKQNNIDISNVKIVNNKFTASAYITSDNVGNQITSFYKGAMEDDIDVSLKDFSDQISYMIISPDKKERMLDLMHEARFLGIPFIFDPGQVISLFSEAECLSFIEGPKVLIFNQFELNTFMEKTNLTREQILEKVPILIETMRESGSNIMTKEKVFFIRSATPRKMIDPTGCGDAYRAGILYGLTRNLDLKLTGQIGALMATYKLESRGTQTHKFTMDEFKKRYEEVYGEKF
jgi:adenosine kinase